MRNIFNLYCTLFKQQLYISTFTFSFMLHARTLNVLNVASECANPLTPLCPCSCVLYLNSQSIITSLRLWSPPPSQHTHTHEDTHIHTGGSHGYRKCLQADSHRHQEPNSDDANGHDLIRQAMPPVKTCKMCWVINTFGAQEVRAVNMRSNGNERNT